MIPISWFSLHRILQSKKIRWIDTTNVISAIPRAWRDAPRHGHSPKRVAKYGFEDQGKKGRLIYRKTEAVRVLLWVGVLYIIRDCYIFVQNMLDNQPVLILIARRNSIFDSLVVLFVFFFIYYLTFTIFLFNLYVLLI